MALDQSTKQNIEAVLPSFLLRQRWFGAKNRAIASVQIEDVLRLPARLFPMYLVVVKVQFGNSAALYQIPLAFAEYDEAAQIGEAHPDAVLAWQNDSEGRSLVYEATISDRFWRVFFRWWCSESTHRSQHGQYISTFEASFVAEDIEAVHLLSGEQSNTSAILDRRFFVKLYRHLEPGISPEPELLKHLTAAAFPFTPRLLGTLAYHRDHASFSVGIVQEAVPVEMDSWSYTCQIAGRFFDRIANQPAPADHALPAGTHQKPPAWMDDLAPEMQTLARALGIRTAEMHRALSDADTPDLRPHAATHADTTTFIQRVRDEAEQTRALLHDGHHDLPDEAAWQRAFARLNALAHSETPRRLIRVHGDFHLGQIARANNDYFILDFEGEPTRTLSERRHRDDALRDIAGMLRSFEYAILSTYRDLADMSSGTLEAWAHRLISACEAAFLDAYVGAASHAAFLLPQVSRKDFLWAYLLDKALYEIRYEHSHRPAWIWLPLQGLRRLFNAIPLN